jgi:hypothetical protein
MKNIQLKQLRLSKGFKTQQQMADKIQEFLVKHGHAQSYTRTAYTMLENGLVKNVPGYIVEALQYLLDAPNIIEVLDSAHMISSTRQAMRDEMLNKLDTLTDEEFEAVLTVVNMLRR